MQTSSIRILIADDEVDILEILEYNLLKEGYEVIKAKDGDEAIQMAYKHKPHLVVLDMMMPKKTGMEVCDILRANPLYKDTLIIFLTAVSDEGTHIKGLETGADDYVTKPISPKVFVSRIQALLRRIQLPSEAPLTIGNLVIDAQKYSVTVDGVDRLLAKKEFALLYLLAQKPGRVFLRNEILQQIWGTDVIVGDRTIDVHIRKIRQKLDLDCITTVKGVGYKFEL